MSSTAGSGDDLKAAFAEALPEQQARLKAIRKNHGTKELGKVTVNMAVGGMRGITGLLYETSLLDAEEGIRFRGHTIPDLQVRERLHSNGVINVNVTIRSDSPLRAVFS